MSRARRRAGERGRVAACAIALLVLLMVACAGAFVAGRALATPELGPPPTGEVDGTTPAQIAQNLFARLAVGLARSPHARLVLTERDLTTIAADRNPDPVRFRNPVVVIRNGVVLISAQTTVGPLAVIAVADVTLATAGVGTGAPRLVATVTGYQVGREWAPTWLRNVIDGRGDATLALDPLINDAPALAQLRPLMECVAVVGRTVVVGFHRPGVRPDPATCSA